MERGGERERGRGERERGRGGRVERRVGGERGGRVEGRVGEEGAATAGETAPKVCVFLVDRAVGRGEGGGGAWGMKSSLT